jgi:hypothetical protein
MSHIDQLWRVIAASLAKLKDLGDDDHTNVHRRLM